ncbi:Nucleolar protein 9 [Coemansia sp. RSA 485]|nr:Nucleolar protein 9 [Coemansia sp. RSA 485]
MGADNKRKTRRGKRGGESKRQQNNEMKNTSDNVDVDMEGTRQENADSKSALDGGYIAPPMDMGDSLFYIDTKANAQEIEEDLEKISPASYGLVNPDLQKYLKGCEDMLEDSRFESTAEDREIFVNNMYSEIKNYELQLTTDKECSRILEKIFFISSDYQIRRFLSLMREDVIRLAVHRFSSHTMQTLLLLSAVSLEREMRGESKDFETVDDDVNDDDKGHQSVRTVLPTFEELILEITKSLTERWSYLMADEFASHILRVLMLVLSGRAIEDQNNRSNSLRSKRSSKYVEDKSVTQSHHPSLTKARETPDAFVSALKKLLKTTNRAMSDIVVRGFTTNPVGSPVLQLMLELEAERGKSETAGSLLDKCLLGLVSDPKGQNPRRDTALQMTIEDVVGSHFLQTVAKIASPNVLQAIYENQIRGRVKTLAFHPISNFVVQSVFVNAKNQRQLKSMIEETAPFFGDLLFKSRAGVVRSLVDSCVRLDAGYIEIINALYGGLGAKTPEERKELINLLAFLMPYQKFVNAEYGRLPFNIQGSLIIQSILQFPGDSNGPILDSFFSQNPQSIFSWCQDPSGSRIIESIFTSPHVEPKIKQKVMEHFGGRYAELAMDKFGSHIFEKYWAIADLDFKETIIQNLVKSETQLQDSHSGRFVLRNCRVDQYKRRAEEWRERERGLERKKLMFKDILGSAVATGGSKPALAPSGHQKPANGVKVDSLKKKQTKKASDVDEIDSMFENSRIHAGSGDSKDKRTEQATPAESMPSAIADSKGDKSLEAVMSAISGTKRKSKSKKDKLEEKDESPKKKSKKAKEEDRKKRRAFVG